MGYVQLFIPPFLQIIQRRGKCRPFRYFTTLVRCVISLWMKSMKMYVTSKKILQTTNFAINAKPQIQGWFDWLIHAHAQWVAPPKNCCFNLLFFLNQNCVYMWATTNIFKGKCRAFRYFTTLGQMCNIAVNEEHVSVQWPPFTHFALYHATICRIVQTANNNIFIWL